MLNYGSVLSETRRSQQRVASSTSKAGKEEKTVRKRYTGTSEEGKGKLHVTHQRNAGEHQERSSTSQSLRNAAGRTIQGIPCERP